MNNEYRKTPSQDLVAYDYESQVWVTGSDAIPLLISQVRETLDLLESTRGEDFAAAAGQDRDEAITHARAYLADLER